MVFSLVWTERAKESFDLLHRNADAVRSNRERTGRTKSSEIEGLFKQVLKCLELLQQNTRHPSLETHEYNALDNPYDRRKKVFEAYAQNRTSNAYRVFWCYGPEKDQITIIDITGHP